MSKRQVEWARRVHAELREALGGKCQACGSVQDLELDCIKPRGHTHHKKGYIMRATFYRRQFRAGNLGLLCADCHNHKTRLDQHWLGVGIIGKARAELHPERYQTDLRTFYPA
jgi:hypothetical protein